MTPKISVIMGIYNCAETLPAAIDSLLAQAFKDWELIMCDDGSRDDTGRVAKEYADRFPEQITLLHNEANLGLNATLNKCLAAARGEYIARQDGDDVSPPDRFQKEVDFLDAHPEYALVSGAIEMYDDNGVWGRTFPTPEPTVRDLVKASPFAHAACMMRMDALKKTGGYSVDKRLLRVEDYHLWYKMYAAGFKGCNLPDVLYSWRDDRAARSRRSFQNRMNEARLKRLIIRRFHLSPLMYIHVLRPLAVAMVPACVYTKLHQAKHRFGAQ